MSLESNVWFAIIAAWRIGMLCAVKDKNISAHRHCGNNIWILRLISCTIDFTFMYNLLGNGNATLKSCISSKFYKSTTLKFKSATPSILIVIRKFCAGNRKLDICDLKVILISSRSMCADQHSMSRIIFAGFSTFINSPQRV